VRGDIQIAEGVDFAAVFLIDTGADFTTIHPNDVDRVWPGYRAHDFENDPLAVRLRGVGGIARFVRREITMRFTDDAMGTIEGLIPAWIAAPTETNLYEVPSLLGRDLIGQLVLVVNEAADAVTLELPSVEV
jgi:hypothetical protein